MPQVDFDSTPKEQVIAMLANAPDDVSFEEIQYDIEMLERLNISERDSREGRAYTQAEFEERMAKLLAELEQEARERKGR